jgi:hypothetical protein
VNFYLHRLYNCKAVSLKLNKSVRVEVCGELVPIVTINNQQPDSAELVMDTQGKKKASI